jgi:hypothetical protein
MEKRILILTAGFGEGHNSAARGIRDGLAAVSSGTATVSLHDIFAETYGGVNDWTRRGYLTLINRAPGAWGRFYRWLDGRQEFAPQIGRLPMVKGRLSQLLVRFRPTVVVSVFPAYPYLFETNLGGAPATFRQVVCITDSITVNAIWLRGVYFLSPTKKQRCLAGPTPAKDPRDRFPVTPRVAELGDGDSGYSGGRGGLHDHAGGRRAGNHPWSDSPPDVGLTVPSGATNGCGAVEKDRTRSGGKDRRLERPTAAADVGEPSLITKRGRHGAGKRRGEVPDDYRSIVPGGRGGRTRRSKRARRRCHQAEAIIAGGTCLCGRATLARMVGKTSAGSAGALRGAELLLGL